MAPNQKHKGSLTAQSAKPAKARIDVLLVERGLAASRERAQALLLAGTVRVEGARVDKPGTRISSTARIELAGQTLRYVSRGGLKLEGAMEDFGVSPRHRVSMDVGSSTGGFTDCLLQHDARKVYCVDVTIDQLDWRLRNDPRIVTIEKNARYLQPQDISEKIELITVDVSFISVAKILPSLAAIAADRTDFLILIKPQFELEKRDVGKGGIVRNGALHQQAIDRVTKAATESGLFVQGVHPSRITGAEGNLEFFLHARRGE